MSDDQPKVDWAWNRCPAIGFFNKVQCQREEGHDGSHIHDYGGGYITGWENRDE